MKCAYYCPIRSIHNQVTISSNPLQLRYYQERNYVPKQANIKTIRHLVVFRHVNQDYDGIEGAQHYYTTVAITMWVHRNFNIF